MTYAIKYPKYTFMDLMDICHDVFSVFYKEALIHDYQVQIRYTSPTGSETALHVWVQGNDDGIISGDISTPLKHKVEKYYESIV